MSQCPECGTAAVRDGQRFCSRCGTDLAGATGPLFFDDAPPTQATPPAMPPPPPQPGYPLPVPQPQQQPYDGGRGRRRTPVLLLAVAAVVAALIGAGGVVLLLGSDDEPTSDTTAEDRRDDADTTSDAGADASTPATATETTSESAEPETFRCWDGSAVDGLESCGPPTGADGMAWVFPSSEDPTCFTEAGVQRLTETDCTATVADEPVRIHYSEWRTRTALESYYGGLTVGTIEPPDGRDDLTAVQVVSRDSDVDYKVAIYYTSAAGLWSVTVYAADEAQYLAALHDLDIRLFGRLRGQPG